jgi:uncharacterized membrane protein
VTLTGGQETALIHLYRGELGRLTAYRRRLDTSTNWAISVGGGVNAYVLGSDGLGPGVVLLMMLVAAVFMLLESDRYRDYQASLVRVRLLESGFFPGDLLAAPGSDWLTQLVEQLQHPKSPLSRVQAIGVRLRRFYWAIFAWGLLAWLLKLQLSGGWTNDIAVLTQRASAFLLPGWLTGLAVVAFYGALCYLGWRTRDVHAASEELRSSA